MLLLFLLLIDQLYCYIAIDPVEHETMTDPLINRLTLINRLRLIDCQRRSTSFRCCSCCFLCCWTIIVWLLLLPHQSIMLLLQLLLLLLMLPIWNYDKSIDWSISSPLVHPRRSVSSLLGVFRSQARQSLHLNLKNNSHKNTHRALWFLCTVVLYNLHSMTPQTNKQTKSTMQFYSHRLEYMDKQKSNSR